jgi:hypothetical protein
MTMNGALASAAQRQRWQRSAWHRLLVAIDARATGRLPTTLLLAVNARHLGAWLDAEEAMPVEMQRVLIRVARVYFRDDAPLLRAAEALRAQLDAMAAFAERGPVQTSLTPDAVRFRATQSSNDAPRQNAAQ